MRASGIHGRVSAAAVAGGRLPYAENTVSCLIDAAGTQTVSFAEARRVLSPLGRIAVRANDGVSARAEAAGFVDVSTEGGWVCASKPWQDAIDEWTHYCHGPESNPVANDTVVGPPKHYQWVAGPLWLRAHDSDASVNSLVTAGGRVFYMVDEAPISLPGQHALPDKWFVIARDAFNGVQLWKRPVKDWGWRAWKKTWFKARPGVFPISINRRLVAEGDAVYVTLGYRAPVSRLDASTGEVLATYEGTDRTNEIVCHGDRLILSMVQDDGLAVASVDAGTGQSIWRAEKTFRGTSKDYIKFKAMRGSVPPAKLDPGANLAVDGEVVCLLDGRDLVCLGYADGKERWRTEVADEGGSVWMGSLILHKDVVIAATAKTLYGLSRASGKKLWTHAKKPLGHLWYEWKDVFVIDDLAWTYSAKIAQQGGKHRSRWPVAFIGYHYRTGKIGKTVPVGNIFAAHHHHRCYRNKATDRYILASRRGTEFVDLVEGKHSVSNWVRGTCHMGMMPANGLLYAPPHPCRCYGNEKLPGFNAVASSAIGAREPAESTPVAVRGPAAGVEAGPDAADDDWPTFRHDALRSGSASCEFPASMSPTWATSVGPRVTPPVVAANSVFVSAVDEYAVVALDARDGSTKWEFATGGRVDSPPTYHRGTVLFGCADGRVHCLRASDGAPVWELRAAPDERLIGSFDRLESAWPVNGSVLVHEGRAYFAAGRSSYLDGGIRIYAVDPLTGEVRDATRLDGPHTDFSSNTAHFSYGHGPGALSDIMQADGERVYMRNKSFDLALKAVKEGGTRVVPIGGFLDGTYFRRANWYYGTAATYGQLIVHDGGRTYLTRMFHNRQLLDPKNYFTPAKDGYRVISGGSGGRGWQVDLRVRVRVMLVAGDKLVVAGPPDVVPKDDPLGAFEGRKGGTMRILSTADGSTLAEHRLDSPPVFNGVAAARGRLFVVTVDGKVRCYEGGRGAAR
jgi:outer membrane protein assembly factor BamB